MSFLDLWRTHLGQMLLDRSGEMSCKEDNIILALLLGDGDVGGVVVDQLLGGGPVPQQLPQPAQ